MEFEFGIQSNTDTYVAKRNDAIWLYNFKILALAIHKCLAIALNVTKPFFHVYDDIDVF